MAATLFHFSFAVDNIDRARAFYGDLLGCPEGRKLSGRADFNFFGHHIVAHVAPEDIVGDKGRKLSGDATPLRHFGVVTTLEDFREDRRPDSREQALRISSIKPAVRQKGTVREQMLMTVRDGCGNAIEFKGLKNVERRLQRRLTAGVGTEG